MTLKSLIRMTVKDHNVLCQSSAVVVKW